MKKTLIGTVVLCGLLGLGLAGIAIANSAVGGGEIMVSPSTIVLSKVDSITVHTSIPFSAVLPGSVALNGVVTGAVWPDSCGHIVARFAVADLGLEPGQAVLELTMALIDGSGFSATDTVTVK
ncbi:MAG: hypothetical protein GXX96_22150 [Planctomycetaceae bacterium]|nr:hypothetical protein [Planctomycetaceae bacterium]